MSTLKVDTIDESTPAAGITFAKKATGVDPTAAGHLTTKGFEESARSSQTLDSLSGTLAINKGGTGQTTQTAAYDALSPGTTKGDITVFDGTNHVRLPVGADDEFLVADAAESLGVKWAATSSVNFATAVMYFTQNGTVTTISSTDTAVKVNATYAAEELNDFTHSSGTLTYTGATTKNFKIDVRASLAAAANDKFSSILIAKNSTEVEKTRQQSTAKASEGNNAPSLGIIQLATNDTIEIFTENNENTDNITVSNLQVIIEQW